MKNRYTAQETCDVFDNLSDQKKGNGTKKMPLMLNSIVWKCYRCNLTFKEENIVDLHKEISKHSSRKIIS